MGTTLDKLNKLINTKSNIRDSIISKGVDVPVELPFGEYPNRIIEISTGGVIPDPNNPVLFFDYDGTLLYSYTEEEARELTELPAHPEHDLLVPDGWTHTLQEINEFIGALHVGAYYKTMDGKTHIFVTIPSLFFFASNNYIKICCTASGTGAIFRINWGDGQTYDFSGFISTVHTYDSPGDYEITIERISATGSLRFGQGTTGNSLIGGSTQIIRDFLTKVYIGDDVTAFENYGLELCRSLSSITIHNTLQYIGTYAFRDCHSLKFISLPRNSMTAIYERSFINARSLHNIAIPSTFMSVSNYAMNSSYALTSVIFSSRINNLGESSLINTFTKECIFKRVIPPTIAITTFGTNNVINSLCKIYVPDESVDSYKTATNWINLANNIYPISSRQ